MRKIIISLALVLALSSNSIAFAPLAIPAVYWVAAATLHVAGAAAGLYYSMRDGSSTSVSSSGNLSRPSNAVWIDLQDSPSVKTENISAQMPFSEVQTIGRKTENFVDSKYPLVKDALEISGLPPALDFPTMSSPLPVGSIVLLPNGVRKKVASYSHSVGMVKHVNEQIPSKYTLTSIDLYHPHATLYVAPNWYSDAMDHYTLVNDTSTPSTRDALPSEFATNVSDLDGNAKTAYQTELDKMFQDSDYIPKFTDDTTGLPYAPPAADRVATPEQVAAYNKTGLATQAKSDALTSAGSSTQNAGNNYTASGGNTATGVGGDPALYQKYLEEKAKEDKLKADQLNDELEDNVTVPGTGGDNEYNTDVETPGKSSISTLITNFISSAPLVAMVKSFTISTSGSSGVVPIGMVYGQDLSIDFTRWEPVLAGCGGVLLVIMHGFAVLIVIRGW